MCGRLPGISADDSRFFLVQEELQRLLVDEAEEAEANCTVDELLSALRKTHPAMTVEESALRAFLKVLDERGRRDQHHARHHRDGSHPLNRRRRRRRVSELSGRFVRRGLGLIRI